MSTKSSMSMHELELESAELLPTRETLCVTRSHPAHSSSYSYSSYSQTATANTTQFGLVNVNVPIGSFDNITVL
jgi:hypothetical protein